MLRSVAVLVSMLATASVYAQDVRMSEGEKPPVQAKPTPAAEGDQPQVVLASTTPMESRNAPLSTEGPAREPSATVAPPATPMRAAPLADCSAVEALLEDAPLAIRVYDARSLSPMRESSKASWQEPPMVWRATHCGSRYVIQVKSRSEKPWVLKEARLGGPNDVVLKVLGVRPSLLLGWSINVIVAEAPQDARADFPLLWLHLIGEDGRVAALGRVVLP